MSPQIILDIFLAEKIDTNMVEVMTSVMTGKETVSVILLITQVTTTQGPSAIKVAIKPMRA